MNDDTMATTKADPYQDPNYQPPHHEPQTIAQAQTAEQPDLAPEIQVKNNNVNAKSSCDKTASLKR